ncbi:hypothetical protein D9756_002794 [Leucocoprinus leucothites]|uniref:WD40 repeat-like protein n=1 Tax=Leucocoprinus leucothites TaxID=201217 RepID=A0A8H5GCH0_9AGAR|nr:hypothetical protein D9756_002794 [Leucoagaricus leucothites]
MWDYQRHARALPPVDPTINRYTGFMVGTTAVVSPCGKTLAVGYGNKITLWNATTGKPINLSHPIQTRHDILAFSSDGRYIASLTVPDTRYDGSPVISIWDAATGLSHCRLVITPTHKGSLEWLFFLSNDNRLVLSGLREEGEGQKFVVHIWGDATLGEPCTTATLPCISSRGVGFPSLLLSPDVLTAIILKHTSTNAILHCRCRNSIEEQFVPHALFNAAAFGIVDTFGAAVFSPSGRFFASIPDHTGILLQIRVWETKTWTEVGGPFETGKRWIGKGIPWGGNGYISFSPDDHLIRFTSMQDGAIWVWNIHTGSLVAGPWRGYDLRQGDRIIISSDGEKLVSISFGQLEMVRLWDTYGFCIGQAQEPVGGVGDFGDRTLIQNGWVKEEGNDSLLFWVPLEHRDKLWRPRNIAVIGVTPTKLDFRTFKYGREWGECIDKEYMANTG